MRCLGAGLYLWFVSYEDEYQSPINMPVKMHWNGHTTSGMGYGDVVSVFFISSLMKGDWLYVMWFDIWFIEWLVRNGCLNWNKR